jgi:hypothetical protein
MSLHLFSRISTLILSSHLLYRKISPIPRLLWPFRTIINLLRWGFVSNSLNPQTAGPPLLGWPRLLIHYIRSPSPYIETVSLFIIWWRAMLWWQGPAITNKKWLQNNGGISAGNICRFNPRETYVKGNSTKLCNRKTYVAYASCFIPVLGKLRFSHVEHNRTRVT